MNLAQKIIKALALALSAFIISIIVYSLYHASYIFYGIFSDSAEEVSTELKVISEETLEDVGVLKIDLRAASLVIKESDLFKVEANSDKIIYSNENGTVEIKDTSKKGKDVKVIVYLPKYINNLDAVYIEGGAGSINIGELDTKSLKLDLGAGATYIKDSIVTRETHINTGVGKLEIKDSIINNAKIELGVGTSIIDAIIPGNSFIKAGIGELNLNLREVDGDYLLNVTKGLGVIEYNDDLVNNDASLGEGSNYISLEAGIGRVTINKE